MRPTCAPGRCLLGLLFLLVGGLTARADEEEPPPVSDADARKAIDRFKREFDTEDLDFQLDAVIRVGRVDHPKVAALLLRVTRSRSVDIRVEAIRALGRQRALKDRLAPRIAGWLDERKHEPRVVVAAIETVGALELRRQEGDIVDLIGSREDETVIAALRVLGKWRSMASLRHILLLWEIYPDDGKWQTGAVVLPQGTDAEAKRVWRRRYGNRVKRARPEVVQAIRRTVNEIIGIDDEEKKLRMPRELREWMSGHRDIVHGRR
jgi:hypothetical protein